MAPLAIGAVCSRHWRRRVGTIVCSGLALVVCGCATDEGSSPVGQAVGLFAGVVGALGGDDSLSNQGLELYKQSLGGPTSSPAGVSTASGAGTAATRSHMAGGASSDCSTYIQRQRLQARTNMRQCQVDEKWLRSVEVDDGSLPQPRGECRGRLNPDGAQNVSFNKCALVYMCAYQTYSAALVYASQGQSCQAALQTALRNFPIPHE
jgi:hypothetical protein